MSSFTTFVVVYLVGGLSFIPILIFVLYELHRTFDLTWVLQLAAGGKIDDVKSESKVLLDDFDTEFSAGAIEEKKGVEVYKKGWMVVTTDYYYHFTELANLKIDPDGEQPLERSQLKKKRKLYAVLRHGNLFLYKKPDITSGLVNAISLNNSFITIWPRDPKNEVLDGSLFTKRTCISIIKNGGVSFDISSNKLVFENNMTNSEKVTTNANDAATSANNTKVSNQYFLYFDNNMDKEDWYFQLINASRNPQNDVNTPLSPSVSARTAHLNTHDMLYLIQSLNSTEGQLHTKWFNALIGRLFLSLQETDALNDYLYQTACKKLSKIKKPGFLDDLIVEKVDAGTCPPLITNPQLREMSATGFTKIAFDVTYKGDMSLIIATKANISLGARFKQREVSMQLAITVKEISGPIVFIIKPPPSNRIWWGFETEPILNFDIEPVVSSSKLSYNVVTNAIKSKLIEGIKESLVMPFMDDLIFYSTKDEIYRGGLWSKKKHNEENVSPEPVVPEIKTTVYSEIDTESVRRNSYENSAFSDQESAFSTTSTPRSVQSKSVKELTKKKMNDIKQTFQNRKSSNSPTKLDDQELNIDTASTFSNESVESNSNSKKSFKTSIKKLGNWYKNNVSNFNDTEEPQQVDDEVSSTLDEHPVEITQPVSFPRKPPPPVDLKVSTTDLLQTVKSPILPTQDEIRSTASPTQNEAPRMISNRRRPVPKTPTNPPNATFGSYSVEATHLQNTPISPTANATEMFLREKTRSISNSSSTNEMHSYMNSKISQTSSQGFVKPQEYNYEMFNDSFEKAKLPSVNSPNVPIIEEDVTEDIVEIKKEPMNQISTELSNDIIIFENTDIDDQ